MYLLIYVAAILSVEPVLCVQGRRNCIFPGKQLAVNDSTSMAMSRPAVSARHCTMMCMSDGNCVAANYEDAGVCHMSSAGHITLQGNSLTTAILAVIKGKITLSLQKQ